MNSQLPVAIVTGASGGIGQGLVQALLKRNYCVVGTSRKISTSKEFAANQNLLLIDGDIGKKETAVRVAQAAIDKFGRIDVLINNAGIFMSKPFTDYTEEDFALMISTNVASFFYMTQQVITQMQKQREGHVVSISTTLTDQPIAGVPAALPVLTKSTIPAMSKELAIEYAADNIRFNTVSPGTVNSPMHANEDHEQLKQLAPLHRLAEISEIVDAVLFLNSAKFISGENIRVDGGAHAGKW
jgi:NAD(P)-dependent dehydrogenase (short-subunit alcohol dehydrogenase family)